MHPYAGLPALKPRKTRRKSSEEKLAAKKNRKWNSVRDFDEDLLQYTRTPENKREWNVDMGDVTTPDQKFASPEDAPSKEEYISEVKSILKDDLQETIEYLVNDPMDPKKLLSKYATQAY